MTSQDKVRLLGLTFTVSNYDDGMSLIEGNVVQSRLLLGHHGLHTDGVVFVNVEIVDVDLPVDSDGCEDSAGVRSPGHVANLGVQVEHEQGLADNDDIKDNTENYNEDHLQSLSQILMIHSEAQVMKMLGMKVFHWML